MGGRKDAGASAVPGYNQPATTGFSQPATTNTFGQPAATASTFGVQKPAGGLFGNAGSTGGFGSTSGGFGAASGSNTGGLFGQTQTNQSNPFGGQSSTPSTTGGLFGQSAQTQPATTGGLFGNTNPFGSSQPQQQQGASTFGGFSANKPAFGSTSTTGFGQPVTGATNTFGQPANPSSAGFVFGQNQQNQQQPGTTGLFGGGFGGCWCLMCHTDKKALPTREALSLARTTNSSSRANPRLVAFLERLSLAVCSGIPQLRPIPAECLEVGDTLQRRD